MKLFQVSSAQLSFLKDTTHNGTHSAISGNDETHDKVAKDTSTDCHFPAEADGNDGRSCATTVSGPPLSLARVSTDESHRRGLTNFPVRDSPGVGHPVGYVRTPVPGAL